jgi:hypothetical protein
VLSFDPALAWHLAALVSKPRSINGVMAGLVPAIHVLFAARKKQERKTWMPATSAGMTRMGWS